MSDVEIGAISGGSGSFVTQKFFDGNVAPGASGDILTITASLGKRVRLDYLASVYSSGSGANSEANIELYVDGVLVNQSSTELLGETSTLTSGFKVRQNGTHVSDSINSISDVVGREIIVKKTSGTTASPVRYAYSEGL